MIEDGVELLIGERIGDVLNECKAGKRPISEKNRNYWYSWIEKAGK